MKLNYLVFFKKYASQKLKKGVNSISIENSTSVSDLARIILLPDDIEKIVIVNGKYVNCSYVLKGGDSVKMFSPVSGG